MARWDDAASAAQRQQAGEALARQRQEHEAELLREAERKKEEEARRAYNALEERMKEVATLLNCFLLGADGISAKRFLAQINQHVLLGYHYDGGGYGTAVVLEGRGFVRSNEPEGTWTIYGSANEKADREAQRLASQREVPAFEAVRYFTLYNRASKKQPEGMVDWLKSEIDKLARPYMGT